MVKRARAMTMTRYGFRDPDQRPRPPHSMDPPLTQRSWCRRRQIHVVRSGGGPVAVLRGPQLDTIDEQAKALSKCYLQLQQVVRLHGEAVSNRAVRQVEVTSFGAGLRTVDPYNSRHVNTFLLGLASRSCSTAMLHCMRRSCLRVLPFCWNAEACEHCHHCDRRNATATASQTIR